MCDAGVFFLAGCCFVTYYTRKSALDAQNALHNMKILPGVGDNHFNLHVVSYGNRGLFSVIGH